MQPTIVAINTVLLSDDIRLVTQQTVSVTNHIDPKRPWLLLPVPQIKVPYTLHWERLRHKDNASQPLFVIWSPRY